MPNTVVQIPAVGGGGEELEARVTTLEANYTALNATVVDNVSDIANVTSTANENTIDISNLEAKNEICIVKQTDTNVTNTLTYSFTDLAWSPDTSGWYNIELCLRFAIAPAIISGTISLPNLTSEYFDGIGIRLYSTSSSGTGRVLVANPTTNIISQSIITHNTYSQKYCTTISGYIAASSTVFSSLLFTITSPTDPADVDFTIQAGSYIKIKLLQ